MNTIIEKIRAEVERQLKEGEEKINLGKSNPYWDPAVMSTLSNFHSFLSDLEKECEKPKKGLHSGSLRKVDNPMKWMEEDAKELTNPAVQEQPVKINIRKELASIEFMGVNDARDSETIARHFYELGRQSKPNVCEGLGREMDRFFTSKEYAKAEKAGFGEAHAARHFAQWGAEHLKK